MTNSNNENTSPTTATALVVGSLLLSLVFGCASTLEYARDSAARRAGQGVGTVVGDKAVKEAKAVIDPSGSPTGASAGDGPGDNSVTAGRTVTGSGTASPAFAGGDSACAADPHCLAPDDVLVCGDRVCTPSHAITLPTAASKQQGRFIAKTNGEESWSDGWIRSRPVQDGEKLAIGQHVVYVTGKAPASHKAALEARWFVGRIIDLSDSFKGDFRSSLGDDVQFASARVVVGSGRAALEK